MGRQSFALKKTVTDTQESPAYNVSQKTLPSLDFITETA